MGILLSSSFVELLDNFFNSCLWQLLSGQPKADDSFTDILVVDQFGNQ